MFEIPKDFMLQLFAGRLQDSYTYAMWCVLDMPCQIIILM